MLAGSVLERIAQIFGEAVHEYQFQPLTEETAERHGTWEWIAERPTETDRRFVLLHITPHVISMQTEYVWTDFSTEAAVAEDGPRFERESVAHTYCIFDESGGKIVSDEQTLSILRVLELEPPEVQTNYKDLAAWIRSRLAEAAEVSRELTLSEESNAREIQKLLSEQG